MFTFCYKRLFSPVLISSVQMLQHSWPCRILPREREPGWNTKSISELFFDLGVKTSVASAKQQRDKHKNLNPDNCYGRHRTIPPCCPWYLTLVPGRPLLLYPQVEKGAGGRGNNQRKQASVQGVLKWLQEVINSWISFYGLIMWTILCQLQMYHCQS